MRGVRIQREVGDASHCAAIVGRREETDFSLETYERAREPGEPMRRMPRETSRGRVGYSGMGSDNGRTKDEDWIWLGWNIRKGLSEILEKENGKIRKGISGILEIWKNGKIRKGISGILEFWKSGKMEKSEKDFLEFWKIRKKEKWKNGKRGKKCAKRIRIGP